MSEEGENAPTEQKPEEQPEGQAEKTETPKGVSIHIGNIPFELTEPKLKEIFGKFGEVLSSKIPTNQANRSKGYGFVSFALKEDAQKAIDSMNNTELDGRKIEVEFAKGDQKQPRSDRRDRGSRGERDSDRRRYSDDRYYRDDRRDRDRYSSRYDDYDRRRYDDDYDRRYDRRDSRRDDYDRRRYDDYDRRYDDRRYDDDRRRRDDRRDYGRSERY
ncbi:hypothetical protein TVAG_312100 [Trichomonas vaginalis G3]|uniref:RRM domain-containing protein n=1 Tax=Trichomonas vaginalis (strain ATCC PRA-98 / G3) TaxID=412133 RepID=A2EHL5_TRIV3|nr:regulation of alternative mRNA splicing, via spliceosome [Trichomonas vaginalis G3]EAY07811.1 hypothetical protein TVAG_312100 [Trichomonas vaginalis G3]KAI5553421.1 regulation of alternative mRNA splicing, via spliceosome [Trichomonas vaginalis G3]|eukprot:XP_001320034.1 hypothetical protein [Trichomonas vaginalis G3]